jgi:hypothetical protein
VNPLYTEKEFIYSKSRDLLLLECEHCHNRFEAQKHNIQWSLHCKYRNALKFCSKECRRKNQIIKIKTFCNNCGIELLKIPSSISLSSHSFCSKSCAATWNNSHKNKGYRRSKLENWIESELTKQYPNIQIDYNKTESINAELDIFIPSLKLAFELNGIFHYEPIYGHKKLQSTQTNDHRKFQACSEKNISLCVIDTTSMKYFREGKADVFLKIITNIINKNLADSTGVDPDAF